MFNIIGAPEAAANLLCELRIAAKKEAKQINNKNGKVNNKNLKSHLHHVGAFKQWLGQEVELL